MKNLLFIPCYRCAPQITKVLQSVAPYAKHFDEIIVIDNLSPDQTANRAKAAVEELSLRQVVKIVENPVNLGLGGSHKMAFQYAIDKAFDHVFILHGDNQGNIADFSSLIIEAKSRHIKEFQFGARFHPHSKLTNYSLFRIFGNRVFNALATILTKHKIHDLGGSGLNLFPVYLLKQHQFTKYADDLTFHVFLLLNAVQLNQPIMFPPISWKEEDQISNVRLFKQTKKLLKILISYQFKPTGPIRDHSSAFTHTHKEWNVLLDH